MTRRRRSKLPAAELPVPRRPYRDSVILYAVLALAIVGVAYLTDGDVLRAAVVAAGFFVVATGWSWWRFRERLAKEAARK